MERKSEQNECNVDKSLSLSMKRNQHGEAVKSECLSPFANMVVYREVKQNEAGKKRRYSNVSADSRRKLKEIFTTS